MQQTLTTNEAADLLFADKSAGWSYAGARALAEYLEQYEEETGEEMEFDRVAIRCDFSEYGSAIEAAEQYDYEQDPDMDEEENEEAALEWLQDQTEVIQFDGGIIIRLF